MALKCGFKCHKRVPQRDIFNTSCMRCFSRAGKSRTLHCTTMTLYVDASIPVGSHNYSCVNKRSHCSSIVYASAIKFCEALLLESKKSNSVRPP